MFIGSSSLEVYRHHVEDLSTYFLYNGFVNMDQNKQNLQVAIADFESGVYKPARKATLAYGAPLPILTVSFAVWEELQERLDCKSMEIK